MAKPKKVSAAKEWYDAYIRDDVEENWQIANAMVLGLERYKVFLDPETAVSIYIGCIEGIASYLKKQQDNYNEFWINLFDVMEIGYDTTENDEDEKTGNYNIQYLAVEKGEDIHVNPHAESAIEASNDFAMKAFNTDQEYILRDLFSYLKEYISKTHSIGIEEYSTIGLIFYICTKSMWNSIMIMRRERGVSELFITTAGLITTRCIETEDGDRIFYKAEPSAKQFIKDDNTATGVEEK